MIRVARIAATCAVIIPVLAFTGDLDDAAALNALWPRLLVIGVAIGIPLLAIKYFYGRQPPPAVDELLEGDGRKAPNVALWGFCYAMLLVAGIGAFLIYQDHPWVGDASPNSWMLLLVWFVLLLFMLAKEFEGEEER